MKTGIPFPRDPFFSCIPMTEKAGECINSIEKRDLMFYHM